MAQTIKDYYELADLLLDLEVLMRDACIWECDVPSAEDFESRAPFAVDTMSFSQWVKFVMIPKFKEIIEAGMPLPRSSNIADMASESWIDVEAAKKRNLISCLRGIDRLLSEVQS